MEQTKPKKTVSRTKAVIACVLCLVIGGGAALAGVWACIGTDGLALLQADRLIREKFVGEYDATAHREATLEAMVEMAGIWQGYLCPCMDARRSQVYNALFYVNRGEIQRLTPDRAIALGDLKKELENLQEPIFLVGDGSNLCYNTLLESVPGLVLPPEHRMHQRATGVALAAAKKLAAGAECSGAALVPNYLRLSQPERERLEREQK